MSPNREELGKWRALADTGGVLGITSLPDAIDAFLGTPAPKGNPATLRTMAGEYRKIATDADRTQADTDKLATQWLPEVWRGEAACNATDVVTAVAHELDHTVDVYNKAGGELDKLAASVEDAQRKHAGSRDPLHRAKNELGDDFDWARYERARTIALPGMDAVLAGIDTAKSAEETAARQFTDYSTQARANQLGSGHLSDSERLVLSQAAVPGGPHADNLILSHNEAARANSRLDELPAGERARFEALLDNAKSPEEKAYLMKALAAGHPIDKVEQFGGQINGRDPVWLRDHLTPVYTPDGDRKPGEETEVTYGCSTTQWEQDGPTCVASSTVTARAMTDPLYSMYLTTGGHPDDPAQTCPDAFNRRLEAEQRRVYDDNRPWYADNPEWAGGYDGMKRDEGLEAANEEIGPPTGIEYEHRELEDAGDRRDVLDEVERAVDEGKPVPVQVTGDDGGHQMMIVGHEGDMLQIYNPWGELVWVTEDQFVNGGMDAAADGLPNTDGVHIPK
ncbi:hypothetical protein EV193_11685 [Herbihabitans rhizosphaerae]|uniref:Peptidoglycan-binding protein n=1 Tax=Herbihabitans rhizosphaerae TaxID=1872711 RepID=A0A4Q7KCJ5_9PSEU|nr:hypothetical protein [Herbihabitans rhizosphaerae]RZS30564.1 hypothetical protein EV193_11685 [Herbihabitans rhizosphaerae]